MGECRLGQVLGSPDWRSLRSSSSSRALGMPGTERYKRAIAAAWNRTTRDPTPKVSPERSNAQPGCSLTSGSV